ncbi:heavy metal-binding domain-containing protein [Namhaeicola litoreus]|uniref:Heavy metal-binding domain-containing protein n=1 Tax=Namhaeicola litoreus TaxID=1052145 RepID=A0ABW3Y0T7_9FLAO
MKKLSILILFSIVFISFTSCKESNKEAAKTEEVKEVEVTEVEETVVNEETSAEATEEQTAHVYQCPMKCEEDKTYSEATTCPKCKMDLKEIAAN